MGRAATGLDTNNDPDFAILPPHFDVTDGPVPGYVAFYPDCIRAAIPFLLASRVYHQEWLQDNLPPQHPLFNQRVWTGGILQRLKSKVLTGVYNNAKSKRPVVCVCF